jgi:hypothetical protein
MGDNGLIDVGDIQRWNEWYGVNQLFQEELDRRGFDPEAESSEYMRDAVTFSIRRVKRNGVYTLLDATTESPQPYFDLLEIPGVTAEQILQARVEISSAITNAHMKLGQRLIDDQPMKLVPLFRALPTPPPEQRAMVDCRLEAIGADAVQRHLLHVSSPAVALGQLPFPYSEFPSNRESYRSALELTHRVQMAHIVIDQRMAAQFCKQYLLATTEIPAPTSELRREMIRLVRRILWNEHEWATEAWEQIAIFEPLDKGLGMDRRILENSGPPAPGD